MGGTVSVTDPNGLMEHKEIELTEREKQLVRATWAQLQDQQKKVSVDIFLRIFAQIPHAKQLFPFRNEVDESLLKHPYFKGHAMRFINAIGMTIVNLDAWEVILIPSLLRLGQQHANIPGFKHEYFITFHQAMHDTLSKHLGRGFTAETKTAWSKICRLITSTVEQGYMEGQATNARQLGKYVEEIDHDGGKQIDMYPGICPVSRNNSTNTVPCTASKVKNGTPDRRFNGGNGFGIREHMDENCCGMLVIQTDLRRLSGRTDGFYDSLSSPASTLTSLSSYDTVNTSPCRHINANVPM